MNDSFYQRGVDFQTILSSHCHAQTTIEKLQNRNRRIYIYFSLIQSGRLGTLFPVLAHQSIQELPENIPHFTNQHIALKIKKRYAVGILAVIISLGCASAYQLRAMQSRLQSVEKTLEEKEESLEKEKATNNNLKNTVNQLETENNTYQEDLSNLKDKADQIQTQLNELDKAKSDLYQKLDEIGAVDIPDTDEKSPVAVAMVQSPAITNTNYLKDVLNQLETTISAEKLEFVDISNNVTETVSNYNSMPSIWPVKGRVTSTFGSREDPINGSNAYHGALDISVPEGTEVKATASGTVIASEYNAGGYGYMVKIDHGNGYVTLYAHNSSLNVSVGDQVEKGDIIAFSGNTGRSTGPHVHYEVIKNGESVDPMDYFK